ncbi:hypothetical protein D3C87_1845770 [compost metagenome]
MWLIPTVGGRLILSTPAGCPSSADTDAMAFCKDSRLPPIALRNASPASVSVSLRVERWNSRTFRLRSSMATFRLTAAGVSANRRAAAEKLPLSALRTNDSKLAKVSIRGY